MTAPQERFDLRKIAMECAKAHEFRATQFMRDNTCGICGEEEHAEVHFSESEGFFGKIYSAFLRVDAARAERDARELNEVALCSCNPVLDGVHLPSCQLVIIRESQKRIRASADCGKVLEKRYEEGISYGLACNKKATESMVVQIKKLTTEVDRLKERLIEMIQEALRAI